MFYTTRQKRYLTAETLLVQHSIYDPYRIQLHQEIEDSKIILYNPG